MKKVWIASGSIVSPLGNSIGENYENLLAGRSGVRLVDNLALSPESIWCAAIPESTYESDLSKFEAITIQAIQSALQRVSISMDETVLVLSTTKGNISFLEQDQPHHPRLPLHAVSSFIGNKFGFKNQLVISNACISGVMALVVAQRILSAGQYRHAVVVGTDVLSRFVVSGFQSLHALSNALCRPFDADRNGINLGESSAALVLTTDEQVSQQGITIVGGGLSNDANHISGPSRTGEELGFAIQQALDEASLTPQEIDFISAHGTATIYNDEMEAKAFSRLGMAGIPMNSLKGYYGHTLGAAGVLEVAICYESLLRDMLIPTKGFEKLGVSVPVNVIQAAESKPLNRCLKTASGFGGCNVAIVLQKEY